MLVTVLGRQVVSYVSKKDDKLKEGLSLYCAGEKTGVEGLATDTIWISKDTRLYDEWLNASFTGGKTIDADAIYETQLGSRFPTLVDLKPI